MSISHLTPAQLRNAAALIERIGKLQKKLNKIHGEKASGRPVGRPPGKRKKISAAGLARIRAGQKARWAKVHAEQGKK